MNSKIKGRDVVPDLISSDGLVITENLNKANEFNDFLAVSLLKKIQHLYLVSLLNQLNVQYLLLNSVMTKS